MYCSVKFFVPRVIFGFVPPPPVVSVAAAAVSAVVDDASSSSPPQPAARSAVITTRRKRSLRHVGFTSVLLSWGPRTASSRRTGHAVGFKRGDAAAQSRRGDRALRRGEERVDEEREPRDAERGPDDAREPVARLVDDDVAEAAAT